MSANCEKLNVKLTGYNCLDIINALNTKIDNMPEHICQKEWVALRNKIRRAYNENERLEIE